jgi:hypothetical protein
MKQGHSSVCNIRLAKNFPASMIPEISPARYNLFGGNVQKNVLLQRLDATEVERMNTTLQYQFQNTSTSFTKLSNRYSKLKLYLI